MYFIKKTVSMHNFLTLWKILPHYSQKIWSKVGLSPNFCKIKLFMIVFGSNYGQLGQGRFEVRWDPRRLGKTKMSKLFFRLIRHYLGRRFIAGERFEPTTTPY